MDVLEYIRRMAIRPLKRVDVFRDFMYCIEFEDGTIIKQKDTVGLRLWLVSMYHTKFELVTNTVEDSISAPLGYFKLLGFRGKDVCLFQNEDGDEYTISFLEKPVNHPSVEQQNET